MNRHKPRSLTYKEFFAAAKIIQLVLWVRLLRVLSSRKVIDRYLFNVMHANPDIPLRGLDFGVVSRVVAAMTRRLNGFFTCLEIALACNYFVRSQGWISVVRLGVKNGSTYRAHAWLEVDGRPLINYDGSYKILLTPESRSA